MIKATVPILLASILLTTSLATLSSEHHPSTHEGHENAQGTIAPPEGERWPTDEALRTGMSRIQAAVEQTTSAPLSHERSLALAGTIEQNVTYIIEHCKLPPKPDAALHVLIARILSATQQLKTEAPTDAAVAQIHSALHDYRDTFDHEPAASSDRH